MCKEYGWELVRVLKNHYEFSVFFKDNNNQFVYFHISDVRYFKNEWYNNILIRTAKNETDYTGGNNHSANLVNLPIQIHYLFKGVAYGR